MKCQKNNTFSIYTAEKSIPFSQKLLINEKKKRHKKRIAHTVQKGLTACFSGWIDIF